MNLQCFIFLINLEGQVQAANRNVAWELAMVLGLEQDACKCYFKLPTPPEQPARSHYRPSGGKKRTSTRSSTNLAKEKDKGEMWGFKRFLSLHYVARALHFTMPISSQAVTQGRQSWGGWGGHVPPNF